MSELYRSYAHPKVSLHESVAIHDLELTYENLKLKFEMLALSYENLRLKNNIHNVNNIVSHPVYIDSSNNI